MDRQISGKPFEVVTIAGYRYTVTLNEVMKWFTSKWFWIFIAGVLFVLIVLFPHNQIYGLTVPERFIYWPLNILMYLSVYIGSIYFGALYATRRPGRHYYTPIGMVVATTVCTLGGAFVVALLHSSPVDLGVFKWMEIIFNVLWASIFEAIHYAFIVPRLRNRPKARAHNWEHFD